MFHGANAEGDILMTNCGGTKGVEADSREEGGANDHIYEYIDPVTITGRSLKENPLYERSSDVQNNPHYERPSNYDESNTYDRL